MPFIQNYLYELPTDLQDKIFLLVNKDNFSNCLKDVDNPKIRLFYKLNNMINDLYFELSYSIYDLRVLGWFWENHENPFDDTYYLKLNDKQKEQLFDTYDLFERDKRLSYKEYTKIYPEYKKIKYYKFKYHNNTGFNKNDRDFINSFIKNNFINNYPIKNTPLIIKKFVFTINYIHIYIHNYSYDNTTPVDIVYNIFWAFQVIPDCLRFLNSSINIISFDNTINHFETYHFFLKFDILNNFVITYFS